MIKSKKSMHISLTKDAHTGLKMMCTKFELSMQQVLEECANLIGEEDGYMVRMLERLKATRFEKKIKKLTSSEKDDIYSLLENNSPFDED